MVARLQAIQFSKAGTLKLPLLDLTPPWGSPIRPAVAAAVSAALDGFSAVREQPARLVGPDTCWVAVLYGRVFCCHHDRAAGLLRLHRLFRCGRGWGGARCACWGGPRVTCLHGRPANTASSRGLALNSGRCTGWQVPAKRALSAGAARPCRDATSLAHTYEVYARQLELSVVDNVLLVREDEGRRGQGRAAAATVPLQWRQGAPHHLQPGANGFHATGYHLGQLAHFCTVLVCAKCILAFPGPKPKRPHRSYLAGCGHVGLGGRDYVASHVAPCHVLSLGASSPPRASALLSPPLSTAVRRSARAFGPAPLPPRAPPAPRGAHVCTQPDRACQNAPALLLPLRDALRPTRLLPLCIPVLQVHHIDSAVVMLIDIMAPGATPISSPLPLAVPLGEPANGEAVLGPAGAHSSLGADAPSAEAAAVLLPPPGASALQLHYPCWLVDGAGGLVYRLQLDLRAIADSTSEHTCLLAFLQRRRPSTVAGRDAAGITLRALRGLVQGEAPLPELRAAFDVVNGFAAEAAAAAAAGSRQSNGSAGSSRAGTPPPGGATPRQPPPPRPVVTPQASQLCVS